MKGGYLGHLPCLLRPGSALACCQGSANGTCWGWRGEEPSGAVLLGER